MKYLILKYGSRGLRDYKCWAVPLYRYSHNPIKEMARQELILAKSLLTRMGLEVSEIEKRLDTLRRESIGGLRYYIGVLEDTLVLEQ